MAIVYIDVTKAKGKEVNITEVNFRIQNSLINFILIEIEKNKEVNFAFVTSIYTIAINH